MPIMNLSDWPDDDGEHVDPHDPTPAMVRREIIAHEAMRLRGLSRARRGVEADVYAELAAMLERVA